MAEISPLVTVLVLCSALMHAGWNAIIKSSREVMLDTALVTAAAALFALPLVLYLPLPARASWPYLGASALIHIAYFWTLASAYRLGDLGHAYPLMRGTAPLLVALFGVLLLGERPSAATWTGIALISAGILSLGWARRTQAHVATTLWALANAAIIATYTLVDGSGARLAGVSASYVAWLFLLEGILFMSLIGYLRRRALSLYAMQHWRRSLGGGICLISAYGIVLWAMTRAPVAGVAALRETSVIFAAVIGTLLLK